MELPINFTHIVQQELSRLKREHPTAVLEVEARPLGLVSAARFHRGLEMAKNKYQIVEKVVEVDTLTDMKVGREKLRTREQYDQTGQVVATQVLIKNTIMKWDRLPLEDYGLRISISSEAPTVPPVTTGEATRRIKRRTSFGAGAYRFDFSEVTTVAATPAATAATTPGKVSYEIEVEIVTMSTEALTGFLAPLKELFLFVFESNLVYTMARRRQLFASINKRLGGRTENGQYADTDLDVSTLTQARNLNLPDLVYGGLTPRDPPAPGVAGHTAYLATIKADGFRKLLVFEPDGVWIAGPPDGLNLLSRNMIKHVDPKWALAIFEGEEIPYERRKSTMINNAAFYVVLYDCLYLEFDPAIRSRPLLDRYNTVQSVDMTLGVDVPSPVTARPPTTGRYNYVAELAQTLDPNSPILTVSSKEYVPCSSPDEFFQTMNYLFDKMAALPYENDGLIFTPNSSYMPTGMKHGGTKAEGPRTLSRYTDIVKWKPRDLNTVDLQAFNGVLYAGIPKGGLQPFHPDQLNNVLSADSQSAAVLEDGVVYEVGWNFTRERGQIHRTRFNKGRPNSFKVAEDIWRTLFNPIDEATLRGRDLVLMRRYHNREKSKLLGSGRGLLLDLGSGRGGDLRKWGTYSKIIAVEPSEPNRVEFERRLAETPAELRTKVTLHAGKAQDTTTIISWLGPGVKADTITMMMSLTFLFETATTLNELVATIDATLAPNGKFLVTVLDGDLVKAAYSLGPTKAAPTGTRLIFPSALVDMVLHDDNHTLEITLADTIVENQTEYLTQMRALTELLASKGINLQRTYLLDGERFLNTSEAALSRLYSAWEFVRGVVTPIPFTKTPVPAPMVPVESTATPPPDQALPTSAVNPLTPGAGYVDLSRPLTLAGPLKITAGSVTLAVPAAAATPTPAPTATPAALAASFSKMNLTLPSTTGTPPQLPMTSAPVPPMVYTFTITGPVVPPPPTQRYDLACFPLKDQETVEVVSPAFPGEVFRRVGCPEKGNSCLLHAILRGFDPQYIGMPNKRQRENYVSQIRQMLAQRLTPETYDKLIVNEARKGPTGEIDPLLANEFSRETLQRGLAGSEFLGEGLLDFLGNEFNIDFYVMKCDPVLVQYIIPDPLHRIYKGRISVLLWFNGSHYELIEVKRGGHFESVLPPTDSLIVQMREVNQRPT